MFKSSASRLPKPAPSILALIIVAAIVAAVAGAAAASAEASSGGLGPNAKSTPTGSDAGGSKYSRLWDRVSSRDKRWARSTSQCESGGDPNAIGGGGIYRGAFQFMKSTWRTSPKSPGGDPIDYDYRTQAVVAVALKRSDGAQHWPVCG